LVNKFRRRLIGTLFIKLELILREWLELVVNRRFLLRNPRRERGIKPGNFNVSARDPSE
jgi:hypothetical protein